MQVSLAELDLDKDEWMAIAFKDAWYLGQFVEYIKEESVYKFHFVERSMMASLFVWPELSGKPPDTSWVEQGSSHLQI